MSMTRRGIFFLSILPLIFFVGAWPVSAAAPAASAQPYHIDTLSVDSRNDFILEPAKQEIFLNPGDENKSVLYVTDRVPGSTTFSIEVEDIQGSNDPNAPVVILQPGQTGPDSGKNFIHVPAKQFTLSFGQRATIPVDISIPKNTSPGGYYAAVLISNEPTITSENQNSSTRGSTRIISRLGSLFFIRVNGPAAPSGQLQDLRINAPTSQFFYNHGPFSFEILFNNTGNIYLTPYGSITIKNIFGQTVDTIPVDAYYSLPHSLRYRDVAWNQVNLFGRYTANLSLNRGYNNTTDTKTIVFWVIPWKFLLIAFAVLFVLVLVIVLVLRTFEIRRR